MGIIVARDDARKREHHYKCKSSHTFPPSGRNYAPMRYRGAITMSQTLCLRNISTRVEAESVPRRIDRVAGAGASEDARAYTSTA